MYHYTYIYPEVYISLCYISNTPHCRTIVTQTIYRVLNKLKCVSYIIDIKCTSQSHTLEFIFYFHCEL